VLFVSGRDSTDDNEGFGKWNLKYGSVLGFTRDGRTVLDEFGKPFEVARIKTVKPDPSLKNDADIGWLEDAIQYHARGWKPLALVAFRNWMMTRHRWTPEESLHYYAWLHWKRRLHHDPDMPLATIAKRLKQIPPHELISDEERKKLLDSLDLALKPRNSPPGSVDALIDALIETRGRQSIDLRVADGVRADPRYRAVLRKGLDAVPALISHLNDQRLTRSYWNLCGWKDLRVRDVAYDILMQLNGGFFPLSGWMDMPETAEALKEWREVIGERHTAASKLGEEKYILSRILGDEESDDQLRPGLMWLLAEKYPQRLPEVFRKCIDTRPEHALYAWEYAKLVAESRIPEADKRKVLEYAATKDHPQVSMAGIYYIRRFDPKFAKEKILLGLKGDVEFDLGTIYLPFIVAETRDPDEWKALTLAMRSAIRSGQVNMICAVLCAKTPNAKKERLAFLRDFLTDEAIASAPNGPPTQAEAQRTAETQLADLLKIETKPYPTDWTARASWDELREEVKELLWP
jgi:hypothetical protein